MQIQVQKTKNYLTTSHSNKIPSTNMTWCSSLIRITLWISSYNNNSNYSSNFGINSLCSSFSKTIKCLLDSTSPCL